MPESESKSVPHIFNMPTGEPFLDHLAKMLIDDRRFGGAFRAGFALHDFTILLPTRRAVRNLQQALLKQADTKSLLMPDIRPLGAVDEEAMPFALRRGDLCDVPPAISDTRREVLLWAHIRRWQGTQNGMAGNIAEAGNIMPAIELARELARFLDHAQTEDIDLHNLQNVVEDHFAQNWQQILDCLAIITDSWPRELAALGLCDPAHHRNMLLAHQAKIWQENAPVKPIIAAGSTGSLPYTARLMKTILSLPQGMIILPGLDMDMGDDIWQMIGDVPAHPQAGLYHLLNELNLSRADVKPFPLTIKRDKEAENIKQARRQFLSLAFLPSPATHQWAHPSTMSLNMDEALSGLSLYEAPDMHREALYIAASMRRVLETKDKTAILLTPNRHLARRVVTELKRWQIDVEDTAGVPLSRRAIGRFVRLILQVVQSDFAPVSLLSVLKQDMVTLGRKEGRTDNAFHILVQDLERVLLRGARVHGGLAGWQKYLNALLSDEPSDGQNRKQAEYKKLIAFLDEIALAFAPLTTLGQAASMTELTVALKEVINHLTGRALGQEPISAPEADEALSILFEDLSELTDFIVPQDEWAALMTHWLGQKLTRRRGVRHPRLAIMGLLEARLMAADVMILGGLNEGVWPHLPDTGPWLSRPMREALGMTAPERRIGMMAHDFVQAAGAREIVLTRCQKTGGQPMVKARWLARMTALLKGAKADMPDATGVAQQSAFTHICATLDAVQDVHACARPAPRPPLIARPHQLSVTRIETLQRNPYAIYARYVLGLKKLDMVEMPPNAMIRGSFMHKFVEYFISQYEWEQKPEQKQMQEQTETFIYEIAERVAGEIRGGRDILTYSRPRLRALSDWLIAYESPRRAEIKMSSTETQGEMNLKINDIDFTLSGRADRIDLYKNNSVSIIDYKTGALPSSAQVKNQKSPQLLLEALIAQAGGFENVPAALPRDLFYIYISGGEPAGAMQEIKDFDEAVRETEQGLRDLLRELLDEGKPMASYTRPAMVQYADDYDHLARYLEWSVAEEVDG